MSETLGKRIQARRREMGLTQEGLARRAEVPYNTLIKIEAGKIRNPSAEVVRKLSYSLGLSTDSLLQPVTYLGENSVEAIWQDVLATLKEPGDFMCISGVDERDFKKASRKKLLAFIQELKKRGLGQKILSRHGDDEFLPGDHLEYRWIPSEYFRNAPIYVYGNKVAMLLWGPPQQAIIIDNEALAEAYRGQFLCLWETAKRPRRPSKSSRS